MLCVGDYCRIPDWKSVKVCKEGGKEVKIAGDTIPLATEN